MERKMNAAQGNIREINPPAKKTRSKKIDFTIETVTPERARGMLIDVRPGAKKLNSAVEIYAQAMAADGWIYNGMPLIFDTTGRLADGVQRLNACIDSKKPFRTAIARNVSIDTLHTIDQQRRRRFQSVLEARGIDNAGSIVRTLSKLIRIENGMVGKRNEPISWVRLDRTLEANPEIIEATVMSHGIKSTLHSTPRPVLIAMALKAKHRNVLRDFLDSLRDPYIYPAEHPGAILGRQLDAINGVGTTIDHDVALGMAILAFNDLLENKNSKRYQWAPSKNKNEPPFNLGLPQMIGFNGMDDARFSRESDDFSGRLAASLVSARKKDASEAGNETIKLRTVTPEMARNWIANNNTKNRKIQKNHIKAIARDVEGGNWMVNAQPIAFSGDPFKKSASEPCVLLNGQHRLHACSEANIPIEVFIATNVPKEAFATYDMHAKRNTNRTGAVADERAMEAVMKLIWRHDNGIDLESRETPSATDLKRTYEAHPDVAEHFTEARRMKKTASASIMLFVIYRVRNEEPVMGDCFLQQLHDGLNIIKGNPLGKVRSKLSDEGSQIPRKSKLKYLLSAWEDYKAWNTSAARMERQGKLR